MKCNRMGSLVLILLASMAGCAGKSTRAERASDGVVGAWQLRSYGTAASPTHPIEETSVILRLEADGSLSGSTGCNSFGGAYKVKGDTLTFGTLSATKKMCVDPEGVMKQETALLGALSAVRRFERDADGLALYYDEDKALRFVEATGNGAAAAAVMAGEPN